VMGCVVGRFRGRAMRGSASLLIMSVAAAMVLAFGVPRASGQAGRGASAAAASSSSWTFQSMPSPAHAENFINAISCASASSCMAVGNSTRHGDITHALTEHWNGAKWSIVPTPRIPDTLPGTVFNGVSCPAQNFCLAVGYFDRQRTLYQLGERWNGHKWSLQLPSTEGGRFFGQLESVSCPNTRMCMAVGLGGTSQRSSGALAERWNGHGWTTTIRRPFPHGSTWTGVSCASADTCMAVAGAWSGSFNGRRWTVRRGPGIANLPAQPSAVSCASGSSCMVVGTAGIGPRYANQPPLAVYWNGRQWTEEHVPYPPAPPSQPTQCVPNGGCIPGQSFQYTTPAGLGGVSCLASDDCQAIGMASGGPNGNGGTMAPHWDGTSWSTPPPPSTPRFFSFDVISCVRGDVCETVGSMHTRASSTLEAARFG
jgi:hypothetical protein